MSIALQGGTLAAALLLALLLHPGSVGAAELVRRIGIYVQPYYEAARAPGGRPRVAVSQQFNGLLGSERHEDILAARDLVTANSRLVTPMTMMVLAIRLYDIGLRDEAVFWFYVAKDRYIVLSEVLDVKAGGLAQVEGAIRNFSILAGPVINGYAFCDLAKQRKQHVRAVEWIENNPYEVMFMTRFAARAGNRAANLKRALDNAKARVAMEQAYLADPKNKQPFLASRKKNEMDDKFCWK